MRLGVTGSASGLEIPAVVRPAFSDAGDVMDLEPLGLPQSLQRQRSRASTCCRSFGAPGRCQALLDADCVRCFEHLDPFGILAPHTVQNDRGTASGEGGIRTHEAAFTAHAISSRAP